MGGGRPLGSTALSGAATPVAVRAGHRMSVFVVVFSGVLLTGIGLSSISIVFPELQQEFAGTPAAELSWVANTFTIVSAATLLPAAALADRHGRERTIAVGLLLFAVGSAVAAVAPSPGIIVVGRAGQALGSSAYTPAAAALLMSAFPPSRLPMALGVWSVGVGASVSIGPPLAGILIAAGGWRWVFGITVPIALGASVVAWRRRAGRDGDPNAPLPDPAGSVLVVAAVVPIVYALVNTTRWGWLDARTLGLVALGLLMSVVFVVRCARHPHPLVDLAMLRRPLVAVGNAGGFVMTTTWFSTYWGMVLFVTSVWGWSSLRAGLATVPVPLLAGVTGILVNQRTARTGPRPFVLAGAGVLAVTPVVAWLTLSEVPSTPAVVGSSVLLGLGSGCVLTPFMTATVAHVPPAQHALATGLNFMTQRLATTFGIAVAITFLTRPGGLDGLHRCLVVSAVGAVAVAGFGWRTVIRPTAVPSST